MIKDGIDGLNGKDGLDGASPGIIVTETENGYTITIITLGQPDVVETIEINHGRTPVITIGENNNWWIDGNDIGVPATCICTLVPKPDPKPTPDPVPNLGNTRVSNLLPNTGESAAGYLSFAAGIAIAAGLGLPEFPHL